MMKPSHKHTITELGKYFTFDGVCSDMTERARLVFALADNFALEHRHPTVEPCHVLRSLAGVGHSVGRLLLKQSGIDLDSLLPDILTLCRDLPASSVARKSRSFSRETLSIVSHARVTAEEMGRKIVGTEYLTLGMVHTDSVTSQLLKLNGTYYEAMLKNLKSLLAPKPHA